MEIFDPLRMRRCALCISDFERWVQTFNLHHFFAPGRAGFKYEGPNPYEALNALCFMVYHPCSPVDLVGLSEFMSLGGPFRDLNSDASRFLDYLERTDLAWDCMRASLIPEYLWVRDREDWERPGRMLDKSYAEFLEFRCIRAKDDATILFHAVGIKQVKWSFVLGWWGRQLMNQDEPSMRPKSPALESEIEHTTSSDMKTENLVFTWEGIAGVLHTSPRTAQRRANEGRFKVYEDRGRVFAIKAELEAYFQACRAQDL